MKICFVTGSLKFSGAEKIISMLMDKLNERGHDISVILLSKKEAVEGFDYATQYPCFVRGNPVSKVLNRIKKIRKIAKENKFDAIISFNALFNIDVLFALMGTKSNVICCDRNDPVYDPPELNRRIRRKIFYPLSKGFVFQTEVIKNYYKEGIRKKSVVIPNFIEADYECVAENKRRKVIATSARLDDNQKNHVMLLKGFAEFSKTNSEYTLEMYGDGPDRAKYEALIKELGMEEKIILCGRVENVSERLKDIEIFVLTSKFEGMPNALIEAMATGLPCISTDCGGGGAAALIENNVNGILIPQNDIKAFTKALEKLASDEALRIELGKNAYKINQRLDINKIAVMWEDAIEKLTKGTDK